MDEIYKIYKHGGSLANFSAQQVFRALKKSFLQVALVTDLNGEKQVWNYVPENSRWHKVR